MWMWDIYSICIYIYMCGDTMRIKQYNMFIPYIYIYIHIYIYVYVEIYRDRTCIYIYIHPISAIYKCYGLSRLNIVMLVSSANSFADCLVKTWHVFSSMLMD